MIEKLKPDEQQTNYTHTHTHTHTKTHTHECLSVTDETWVPSPNTIRKKKATFTIKQHTLVDFPWR